MFEHVNLILFSALNASAGLSGWQLFSARFAAQWLILLVPLTLAALWIGGTARQRQASVHACLAAIGALAVNAAIGLLWFHPRPFMAGIGHTFLHHAPDSSFPSDHATILFTVALALARSRADHARRIGALLLAVAVVVAWACVFLGVHYPMDMFGALVVSLVITTVSQARVPMAASARLVPMMESVYHRMLAAPIARGWLRP